MPPSTLHPWRGIGGSLRGDPELEVPFSGSKCPQSVFGNNGMEFSTRRRRKSFAGKDKERRKEGRKKTDEKREQMVGRSRPGLMPHGGKSPGFIKPSRRMEGRRMKRELAVKFEAVRRINTCTYIYSARRGKKSSLARAIYLLIGRNGDRSIRCTRFHRFHWLGEEKG